MNILTDKFVLLYFQTDAMATKANADMVMAGAQDAIEVGDRILFSRVDGVWEEGRASVPDSSAYHPMILRLPEKYQSSYVMVTCPDCHLTYRHQHIFSEGTK